MRIYAILCDCFARSALLTRPARRALGAMIFHRGKLLFPRRYPATPAGFPPKEKPQRSKDHWGFLRVKSVCSRCGVTSRLIYLWCQYSLPVALFTITPFLRVSDGYNCLQSDTAVTELVIRVMAVEPAAPTAADATKNMTSVVTFRFSIQYSLFEPVFWIAPSRRWARNESRIGPGRSDFFRTFLERSEWGCCYTPTLPQLTSVSASARFSPSRVRLLCMPSRPRLAGPLSASK